MVLDFLPHASFFIRECSVPRSSLYNCDCGKTHHDDLRTKSLKIFDDGQFLPKTSLALVELHVARHNNDLCKLLGRCAELPREVASEPLTRRISSVFPRRQSISVRRAEIRWSGREARPGRPLHSCAVQSLETTAGSSVTTLSWRGQTQKQALLTSAFSIESFSVSVVPSCTAAPAQRAQIPEAPIKASRISRSSAAYATAAAGDAPPHSSHNPSGLP